MAPELIFGRFLVLNFDFDFVPAFVPNRELVFLAMQLFGEVGRTARGAVWTLPQLDFL